MLPGTVAWRKTMLAEGSRRSAAATARLRIGRRNPEVAGESGEIGEGGFFFRKKSFSGVGGCEGEREEISLADSAWCGAVYSYD